MLLAAREIVQKGMDLAAEELEASKADYANAPGLQRLMLGVSADNKSVIEISVWESKPTADMFLSKACCARP